MENGGAGGGIYVAGGNARITRNVLSGNKGITSSGIEVESGNPKIAYNTISANLASTYSVGLMIGGDSASVSFNTISGNSGGMSISSATAMITDNVIVNNLGPGVSLNGGSQTLLRNEIRGNGEGGIWLQYGELLATENVIKANRGQYGGGVYQMGRTVLTLRRNTIVSNTSQRNGGGVWCFGNATIADNLIANNIAGEQGGGIAIDRWYAAASSTTVNVLNNTLVGNRAGTDGGACALLVAKTVPEVGAVLANNIFASNASGVYVAAGLTPTFSHNSFYQNTAYDFQGAPDPIGTNGNVLRPPQFIDAANGDYHLFEGSSCIDTGDDAYVQPGDLDLDGKPRIQGGHVDGGCYEFATPTTVDLKAVTDTMKVVAGIYGAIPETMIRLNPDRNGVIDLRDVVLLARKMTGLSP